VNLIVGDYFKAQNVYVDTVAEASEIIKWFNSHTYALGLLRKEQKTLGMQVLSLILACLTRWTSHYLSCNRLLDLKKPIQRLVVTFEDDLLTAAGDKPEQQAVAKSVLKIAGNPLFWSRLEEYV
jgi:hypothetical protein